MNQRKNKTYLSSSYHYLNNPWTINYQTGILSWVNLEEKKSNYFGFGEVSPLGYSGFIDVLEIDGKLYSCPGFPLEEEYIWVVDLESGKEEKIALPGDYSGLLRLDVPLFAGMIQNENYLFFVPCSYPGVLRLNTKNNEIDVIDDWVNDVDNLRDKGMPPMYVRAVQYELVGEYLYLPCYCLPIILKININSLTSEIVQLEVPSGGFSCICHRHDGKFLMAGARYNQKYLYIWNEGKNSIDTIGLEMIADFLPVRNLLMTDAGDAYVFPWTNWSAGKTDIYCLDNKTGKMYPTGLLSDYKEGKPFAKVFDLVYVGWKDEATILFVTGRDFAWHEFNVKTKEHVIYDVFANRDDSAYEEVMKEYKLCLQKNRIPMYETEISLEEFIKL